MKNYTITMPIAGAIMLTVEAENEEQAKEKFYDAMDNCRFDKDFYNSVDNIEIEFYESMGQGNVRHYQYDKMEIEESEIED